VAVQGFTGKAGFLGAEGDYADVVKEVWFAVVYVPGHHRIQMVILVKERLPTFVADNGDHIFIPALLHKVLGPGSLYSKRWIRYVLSVHLFLFWPVSTGPFLLHDAEKLVSVSPMASVVVPKALARATSSSGFGSTRPFSMRLIR